MERIKTNGLNVWQFENLRKEPAIKHFVTDRNTLSTTKEFTLSLSSSPDKEMVQRNRAVLATALGTEHVQLYIPHQIHEANILQVTSHTSKDDLINTDALITNQPGICIAVMSADCVTIILYDKRNRCTGAVHAGWRGTVAKILEKTLHDMNAKFGTKGEDVIAGIGPSVCQESYEVGEEVIGSIYNAFGKASGLVIPKGNNKGNLDLWKANKLQLLEFGLLASHIELSNLCTVKNNNHFFSARKGDAGRFAAGIMLV